MNIRARLAEIGRILDRTATWESPVYRGERQKLNRERGRLMRELEGGDRNRQVEMILGELERTQGRRKRPIPIRNMDIPLGVCGCGCGDVTRVAESSNRKRGRQKGRPMRFIRGHNQRSGK